MSPGSPLHAPLLHIAMLLFPFLFTRVMTHSLPGISFGLVLSLSSHNIEGDERLFGYGVIE
ncbi:hypothetical protein BC826DRAFT_1027386 [Russula brevipes]|nr:hypothetical protein BC826DRAFT_1027386 [Russula brevipes]